MPLQDELRELCVQVGPHVFDDADTFRGAFDDFIPEGAATPGDLRLLVDAISTGAFQRLVQQLELNANPPTAIAAESERLARDRGTIETEGARWALSVLAFARGLTEEPGVTTRPSVLGRPSQQDVQPDVQPDPPRSVAPTPANGPDDVPPTFVPPESAATAVAARTPAPPPPGAVPPSPAAEPQKKRGRLPLILAAAVAVVVAVVTGVVLLGGSDDDPDDDARDSSSASGSAGSSPSEDSGGVDTSVYPAAPADLPALPEGFSDTFQMTVRLPTPLQENVQATFGERTATEVFGGGDPTNPDIQLVTGPEPTAARVRELVGAGIPVRLKYYVLRQVGQGGADASGQAVLDLMADDDLMAAYWTTVRDMLTALGGVGGPVEMVVEPDLPSELLSEGAGDATAIPTSVAASGVEGLDGLPDTFAGWAQGWLALRDELAPEVRIGLSVSPWQIAGDLLPDLPTPEEVDEWAAALGESYATLGARFDFLDNIMVYSEGGSQGEEYIGDEAFFDRLLIWVEGISAATDTRVILDNVPVGNSVYRTLDDTDFHWRDSWVEWILGDDDFDNLIALRDAGVIGIIFGVDGGATTTTCPCDAADDGVSNSGNSGKRSTSADDDGGYLAERLLAYSATGGAPL